MVNISGAINRMHSREPKINADDEAVPMREQTPAEIAADAVIRVAEIIGNAVPEGIGDTIGEIVGGLLDGI